MNKLIIPIIAVLILAAGISGYFILQKTTLPKPSQEITSFEECAKAGYPILEFYPRQCKTSDSRTFIEKKETGDFVKGKCGDGICDAKEKANPDLCSKDCEGQTTIQPSPIPTTIIPPTSIKDFPFGIHSPKLVSRPIMEGMSKPIGVDNYGDLAEVGAKWVRHAGFEGVVWGGIEKQKGVYDWKRTDFIYGETYKQGIKMIVGMNCFSPWDKGIQTPDGTLPKDMSAYLAFLEKAVERYDGDGIDDVSGSPVVDVWQIQNEVDGERFWQDTPENYALLLKESYRAVKKANPNAKVAIAGVATPRGYYDFYMNVLDELAKDKSQQYFDIFDFHWSGQFVGDSNYRVESFPKDSYPMDSFVSDVKKRLDDMNYKDVSVWITEMSDYSDQPNNNNGKPYALKSESYQASQIIKRYIYPLANGVNKIFWISLTEWSNFGGKGSNGYFDAVGLINNPKNGGQSYKKLAYYTYKKMVEVLEGSDWGNIQTIQESDGVYIYKFIKSNKSIWVAWNDNEQEKQITIFNITSSQAKITQAVPKYESGKEVTDYNTAFDTETKTAQNSKISITLGNVPVLVEEK